MYVFPHKVSQGVGHKSDGHKCCACTALEEGACFNTFIHSFISSDSQSNIKRIGGMMVPAGSGHMGWGEVLGRDFGWGGGGRGGLRGLGLGFGLQVRVRAQG